MSWHLHQGDCLDRLLELEDASIDAVVTDPPYGIGFMGHEWDQPGAYAAVRANGTPSMGFREKGGRHGAGPDAALERQMARAARRGSQRPAESGAGHQRDRDRARKHPDARWQDDRSGGGGGAMHAGRYDLSPSANRRFQAWCEAWGAEVLRVLKPGGHAVVFGSPRTYHRLTAGLEDAGFEIRDTLAWLFGSGFPKSRNLDGEHAGWGTALKPAHEPIVLARKPLTGTVAATVAEHGTGALHIDACRIATDEDPSGRRRAYGVSQGGAIMDDRTSPERYQQERPGERSGRWPANVVLDEDAAALLDEQTGELRSGAEGAEGHRRNADKFLTAYGDFAGTDVEQGVLYGDRGGASRFYYVAKASTVERNAGLDGLPEVDGRVTLTPTSTLHRGRTGGQRVDERDPEPRPRANVHPTVKPIDLMRWLVRLVTPPGGLVLDPFTGSGTTGCAAVLEGMRFVGVEREASYLAIADARIRWWAAEPDRAAVRTSAGAAPGPVPGQASLLDDEDAA